VASAAVSAGASFAQTITGSLLDAGIAGLADSSSAGSKLRTLMENTPGGTAAVSNFLGGIAGQGVNAAFGGDFTLNVLNFGFLANTGNQTLNNILSSGLLELHLEKGGAAMNIGTGGADASLGTIASVLKESAAVVPEAMGLLTETLADNIGMVALIAEKLITPKLEKEEKKQLESVFQQNEAARQQYTDPPPLPDDMAASFTSLINSISDSSEKRNEEDGKDNKTSPVPGNSAKLSDPFGVLSGMGVVSLTNMIDAKAAVIENLVEKGLSNGIISDKIVEMLGNVTDWISKVESGENFTFLEGFYARKDEAFVAKMATGNMATSGLAAGFYEAKKDVLFSATMDFTINPFEFSRNGTKFAEFILGIRFSW
jgi:hypothetical protein